MKWEDIGGSHLTLFTRKKKGGHLTPRRVPISAGLAEALRVERTFSTDGFYVFQQDGRPEPHVHRWSTNIRIEACKDAGVRYFNLHSWRHYHASSLAKNLSIPQIQRRLGHGNATTTDRYLHDLDSNRD